jgi:exopolyphosphatase/guanosine-5'-triphosphate,3'-diphosphate pyrophosphatase
MRIATIDIGTNSIHMVIADTLSPGAFEVVDREREVVQIGRGSFHAGRLRKDAIARSVDALSRFVQLARRLRSDRILCTATAAVREARNGGTFLEEARARAGISPRVIPADEEGRLIYLAVKAALGLGAKPALIVDIGGGSMQIVVGDREKIQIATSAPLGALRLTELFLDSDPPSQRELAGLRRHVRREARAPMAKVMRFRPRRVYGSSGSIHALAHLDHWQTQGAEVPHINGYRLGREALRGLTRRLARMSLEEREQLPGLDARRAGIIVPGAVVLLHVLDTVGADAITVSDYGVREGLVTDYIASNPVEVKELAAIGDLRLRSVVQLLGKMREYGPHPKHVAFLAMALWDQLRRVHQLPPETRDLLHYAALLHDVGAALQFDNHAEHSAYMIRNGNLRGLSAQEVQVVACVARYHAKGRPSKSDPDYGGLPKPWRHTVQWLAALLRVGEALDRSHYQLIRGLRVVRRDKRLSILVTARRDAQLELWAARRRTGLLAQMIGSGKSPGTVRVRLDPASPAPGRAAVRTRRRPARAGSRRAAAKPSPRGTRGSRRRSGSRR